VVIVVVGSPIGRQTEQGIEATGVAATVGRVAAAAGAQVQLVGKVGEGAAGDAVLLSLVRSHVGHVAVLRDASAAARVTRSAPDGERVLGDEEPPTAGASGERSRLDSGDLELALRYLPDYRVIVVTDSLEETALGTVVAAARWSGAQLIIVVSAGSNPVGVPEDATVLESPDVDPDGAFGAVVGAYAAALDRGAAPAEAFASASAGSGWSAVVD